VSKTSAFMRSCVPAFPRILVFSRTGSSVSGSSVPHTGTYRVIFAAIGCIVRHGDDKRKDRCCCLNGVATAQRCPKKKLCLLLANEIAQRIVLFELDLLLPGRGRESSGDCEGISPLPVLTFGSTS